MMIEFVQEDIRSFKEYIESSKRIVIAMHANVDGDSMGSAMALYGVLKESGKEVTSILADPNPGFLAWLPYSNEIEIYIHHKRQVLEALDASDMLICVDFNAPHRTGVMKDHVAAFEGKKVLIDHHLNPDSDFFDVMFSYPGISSTAELLFQVLKASGLAAKLTADTAAAIFCGIMTDTGSFSHTISNPDTFILSGELLNYGFDAKKVHDLVYNNNSIDRLLLRGFAINKRLVLHPEHKVAYFFLSREDLDRFNHKPGDTEGLVNYPLSIKEIEMSVLFTERPDMIKMSLRSKEYYAVNELADKYYNGGGHKNAAGGKFFGTMDEAIAHFESLLPTLNI